ncbi:MAG: TatD family hydrolase [Bacteroidales bacterium]|nr:TatD family hydrolase [Bacteroidales bacterium]
MIIDTHTHLYCEEFDADCDAAVQRALDSGVSLMLLPAIDSGSVQRQENLWRKYPGCFRQMTGVHPTSIKEDYEQEVALVESLLLSSPEKYVAIGEIGLDFYWDSSFRLQQEDALMRQLDLAERYDKPVALHIRNAYDEFFQLIERRGRSSYRGVLHCYSGTLEQAWRAVEMGFYLGIGGVLTYKKSTLPYIVSEIPLERLLLETDAPYLAPVPFRGHRNESAYIVHVAERMADIKQIPVARVADVTTANALSLFRLS